MLLLDDADISTMLIRCDGALRHNYILLAFTSKDNGFIIAR